MRKQFCVVPGESCDCCALKIHFHCLARACVPNSVSVRAKPTLTGPVTLYVHATKSLRNRFGPPSWHTPQRENEIVRRSQVGLTVNTNTSSTHGRDGDRDATDGRHTLRPRGDIHSAHVNIRPRPPLHSHHRTITKSSTRLAKLDESPAPWATPIRQAGGASLLLLLPMPSERVR